MLFNSISYLVFLALAVLLYWVLPRSVRRGLLLVASLVFYGLWRVEFLLLIVFSAFVDYYFSLKIYDIDNPRYRKALLLCSLTINLGLLAYFKYAYFIVDNIAMIGSGLGQDWRVNMGNIILPLGISFYTFLSISYTVDVYRRIFDPIRSFSTYLTYVMFWPHMIAGPILRASELIPQLTRHPRFSADAVAAGLKLILCGLFLKVGLADHIGPMVNDAFAVAPAQLGGLDVWTMAYAFGLQIYFDFAGYSLIAVGSARLLGIIFPDNFNWPYLAVSPRDFWKRWHITLSAWIRDYLYLPLTGRRFQGRSQGGIDVETTENRDRHGTTAALFVTWFLMGLWHGASWSFALWGLWHATLIFAYRLVRSASLPISAKWAGLAGWLIIQPLIMLGWIPFRAGSLEKTIALLGRIFDLPSYAVLGFRENFYLITGLIFFGMVAVGLVVRHFHEWVPRPWMRDAAEIGVLATMIFVVFVFLRPIEQFIYFQF